MASIDVIKRDGSVEAFDTEKLSDSVMNAALAVGGEDYDLADEIANNILDMLESNEISEITAEDLQNIVEKTLIEDGHAATAKVYILKAADRNRMREMDNALMKSFEEITFKSEADSEIKRENANIDSSTAMGTMLKYGSEAAKSFNLLYLMSEDIAEAHKNCDIHIHDLDFLSLTETCVSEETLLCIKINDIEKAVTAYDLYKMLGDNDVDTVIDTSSMNLYVMSDGKYTKVKNVVAHRGDDKKVLNIKCPSGELKLTDNHRVTTVIDGVKQDIKASELKVGDILSIPEVDKDRFNSKFLDIVDMYTGDNLIITNTREVLDNIKDNGNWKQCCDIFDYTNSRYCRIRSGHSNMTIKEFKMIEHLTSVKHSDLKIAYKRTRSNESINGVIPLSFELGNFIGLMYTEGSITEHESSKQESNEKKACFCNYNKDLIEQFNNDARQVFNNVSLRDRTNQGNLTGTHLSGYLAWELFHGIFGYKYSTDNIRLADWMYTANSEFISGFLAGVIDGDGCVQKDGYRVSISSVSLNMLKDIQKLLLLRGIESSIKETTATEGTAAHFVNNGMNVESIRSHNNYKLEITGNLNNKIGWVNSKKVNTIGVKDSNKFPYKCRTITEIEEVSYKGLVFDLETEDHHFTANGINVHNCMQIPLDKLFEGGFNTGHGFLRQPGSIRTAAALAAIAIQSDQNDQHGGQSIPMLDYYLAPYVALSYVKNLAHIAKLKFDLSNDVYKELKSKLVEYQKEHKLVMNDECENELKSLMKDFLNENNVKVSSKRIDKTFSNAYDDTYDDTFQAMEAFIHNLNTMHCLPASEKIWVLDTKVNELRSITMEELHNEFEEKRFKVISLNKETGKSEFKFITHCEKLGNNRTIVKITDNQGRTVRVTDNHRVMTLDGLNIGEAVPDKCEYTLSPRGIELPVAKYDLCVSDYGKPRSDNAFKNDHVLIDENFAEFIGYYMADGCILGNTSTCCIASCGKVPFSYMEELLKRTFNCEFKTSYTYFNHSKNGKIEKDIRIQLGMPLAKMIADKFGRVGKEKKIPMELMCASREVKLAFLKAYFSLDGRKDSKYSELSTVNKELQAQTALMLSSLGVSSHYTTRNCSNGFDSSKERQDIHFLTLSGHDSFEVGLKDKDETAFEIPKYNLSMIYDAYKDECDKITGRRKSKLLRYNELNELIDEYELSELEKFNNFFVNNIENKEVSNSGEEYVYDISVEDNENFLTYECIFVHNSRAGAQVPFSSVNYGTDTSTEGRMVMETILKTTWDGLGNGETPIFPIQILKLKDGINMNPGEPNYDIFELACKVSARRLYPNFVNLDAPYNAELYVEGHPETEMATMGCRTRVGKNVYDPNKSVIPGRGNLSFTSINLPRLGILAKGDIDKFFELLDEKMELVHRQLLERFEIQCKKHPINYPFLMGQGLWLDSEKLGPNDDIREILKHGTLTVGFIGLAETLVALTGKHHGESEESQKLGLQIVQHMRDYTDAWSKEEHMNYSVLGTPAEGLSGRFVRADRKLFGTIPGVTDRDYYTNSSHVPVYYPISAFKKVEIEAPFHSIENGGHILYIEMDGDPTKNLKAYKKIVKYMHDKNAGYFAINHPVDRDSVCQYVGIIDDVCPRCGRREGEPMTMEMWRKLNGYANAGNASTLGACGNPDEEADRVPNMMDMSDMKFERGI